MAYATILCGTDGSETAARAVRRASRFAVRMHGRVVLVCATGRGAIRESDAAALLERAARDAAVDGVAVDTLHAEGPPDDVVLAAAAERAADLVVVGNAGMGRARRLGLGPVPERIAREAACDVLIVHTARARAEEPERVYKRILVGSDGSPTASEAARKAFDLAMTLGIGVTLLYAAGDAMMGAIALENTARAKPRGLGVETRVVEGEPAEVLVSVAREEGLGLIVVGNRGMSGMRRVLLGSVPSRVAHTSSVDVLIAKTVDRTVDDIAPGQGALVRAGGKTLAVYRGQDGSLIALSPRCRHMGCTVDWNAADATWDCGCHGSRYAKEGTVIHGPAEEDLIPERLDRLSPGG